MKFDHIAHDNQSKSMKKSWPGKLSSFRTEETLWRVRFSEGNNKWRDCDLLWNLCESCCLSVSWRGLLLWTCSYFFICPASTGKEMDESNWSSDLFTSIKYSKTDILAFCYWHNYASVDSTCISIFFCLGWQIPGGGDTWAVKSPGVGTKEEDNCPVLRQHCNIFH